MHATSNAQADQQVHWKDSHLAIFLTATKQFNMVSPWSAGSNEYS